MVQFFHQIIHYDLGITYFKMSISEKIKAINKKIEQNKAQYDLDRQTAQIYHQILFIINNFIIRKC